MDHRRFSIRILIPTLFLTGLACTVTGRLFPKNLDQPAPAQTFTAESTQTETPSRRPTVTRRPSSTPAPPCVPALGSDAMRIVQDEADALIPGGKVIWFDDFICSDLSYGWDVGYLNPSTKVTVIDGVLTFSTREASDVYDGIGRTEWNIQDRTGILVLFRFSDGAAANLFIHTGAWQTPEFRRWGMQFHYDPQLFPTWNYWKGLNGVGEYFPEYVMRPDAWFYLMIRLGESGDVTMKVWEKDRPENHADFQRSVNSTWAGRRWWALFQVINGTVELDRYWEAPLSANNNHPDGLMPPLVELHLHLEGAIPLPALWELIRKYGGDPSVPDMDALKRRFTYKDFPHFIQTWIWKNSFLREYEDFAFIAEHVAQDLRNQNVVYVEAHYSPSGFVQQGLDIREITRAVRSGLDRVKGIEVALIADLIRDLGPESAARTLQEVKEIREYGIAGIGLGGSEQSFPPELFTEVYADARRSGLHSTAHAGEAAGAASIWGALRSLGVERIGHGTRAEEDPELLDYLAEKQIPVEMCPLSNIRTGVTGRIEAHPVRRYFDRGLLVTISTDDPKMFGNSIAEEYRILDRVFGFSPAEIREVMENSVKASWMEAGKKKRWLSIPSG